MNVQKVKYHESCEEIVLPDNSDILDGFQCGECESNYPDRNDALECCKDS